jgi:hypothetical protein
LNGAQSFDPFGDPLTFAWTQVAGTTVTLAGAATASATFTAPLVPTGGETLTFELTVSSVNGTSAPDTVDVVVNNVNHAPVADAGDAQAVGEGTLVTLDGSASFDQDGGTFNFAWVQTAGTTVSLTGAATSQPSFTAPDVGPAGETLTFELTVDDGDLSAADTVDVLVENVNHAPVADAGDDQTVDEGTTVQLDGSDGDDADGETVTFAWTQVGGTAVTLSDATNAGPTFTAPDVGVGGETLTFQLVVNDGPANSGPDMVAILVQDTGDAPACGLAVASRTTLWPPNHKMLRVDVLGVSDPDGGDVTISITGVTQDEPVNGSDDGDTSPDAVVQGGGVLLRAERQGTGNGRVYRVSFHADDGEGGSCDGIVHVSVPPGRNGTAANDGQLYSSL